jgi:hypothetical protein
MKINQSIFGPPSLGNHWRDAKNLSALLESMKSGGSTFKRVVDALYEKHGSKFEKEMIREVLR